MTSERLDFTEPVLYLCLWDTSITQVLSR